MDHKQFWTKVRDAAYDGRHGSIEYAIDRLKLIHETAILALEKLDAPDPQNERLRAYFENIAQYYPAHDYAGEIARKALRNGK